MVIKIPSIRITHQKLKIMDYLWSVNNHPTAEEVHNAVKKNIPTISLATVYRNLHSLADDGDIVKLEVNKEFRFDGDISHHQHCICKNCGGISEIFQKQASRDAIDNARTEDFDPHSVRIVFHGLCKDCK